VERIVGGAAADGVVAGVAEQAVGQAAADDRVVAGVAVEGLGEVVAGGGGSSRIGRQDHRVIAAERVILAARNVAAGGDAREIDGVVGGGEEGAEHRHGQGG